MEEDVQQVQLVFWTFTKNTKPFQNFINPSKCKFGQYDIIFLGHHINSAGSFPSSVILAISNSNT